MSLAVGIGVILGTILVLWLIALCIDAAQRINEEDLP